MTEPVSQHTIAGTVLTMPVKIRKATQHTAMFSVDADAAQRMIDYSGLQVCRYRPGRAVVALMLVHYHRRRPRSVPRIRHRRDGQRARGQGVQSTCAAVACFIHHLPVDQAFTLEAGRAIWGFPKVMADFTIRDVRQFGFDASIDGQLVAGMEFRRGLAGSVGGYSAKRRCFGHIHIATA